MAEVGLTSSFENAASQTCLTAAITYMIVTSAGFLFFRGLSEWLARFLSVVRENTFFSC